MRGTCSPGFIVRAEFDRSRSSPTPFSTVATESMVPVSHILWSHLWLGHRDRRVRPRPRVRARLGEAAARPGPADRAAPVAPDERAVAAARRGPLGPARVHRGVREPGARAPLDDVHDPALQQPQDRRLRAGPARLPGRDVASAGSSATRTTRRSASAGTCATRCRPALMVANERIHQTNASLLLIAKEV